MSYSRETLATFSETLAELYVGGTPDGAVPATAVALVAVLPAADAFLTALLRSHAGGPGGAPGSDGSPASAEARGLARFARLHALGLTPRECEVAYWIAEGKRDAEIATILGCAPKTVSKHVENLLAKLGGETRLAAAYTAQEWLRAHA